MENQEIRQMTITVDGDDFTIRFTYRTCLAISTKLGNSKLADMAKMAEEIGLDNVPNLVHIAIKESGRKTKVKAPSTDKILDEFDDNPALFGEFITAYSESLAFIMGPADDDQQARENALQTGN